jgi:hypothetical protein
MDGNIRTDGQVHADGMDAAVTRQDVRLIVVDRRDDPAIPDERRCHLIHPSPAAASSFALATACANAIPRFQVA